MEVPYVSVSHVFVLPPMLTRDGFPDLNAFCAGRTLLPTNYWCEEVASIGAKDPCARHALLAFSTAYVLDFQPTEEMRRRANHHYRTAVRLIDQALHRQETYRPGNDDGIVAAMVLILSNDVSAHRPTHSHARCP